MKIYAHRGFSHSFPEGSKTAYIKAISAGADGLECDIRLTRDGIPVCFHDRTTTRITGKRGFIGRLTLADMRSRYELITLSELLDLAISSRVDLLVETKHPTLRGADVERAVQEVIRSKEREIKESGIAITVISFSIRAVLRARKFGLEAGYIVKRRWRLLHIPTEVVAVDIELINRKPTILKKLLNYKVLVWTVNSKEDFSLVKSLGVLGVITDRPDRAKELHL